MRNGVPGGNDVRGEGALAATVVTWASAFPGIRVGLRGYAPWALGLGRLLVAALALLLVIVVVRPRVPSLRQWGRVLLCGLIGQTLYQGLLMTGEVSVPPGTASVLIATAPIFSVLAAAVVLREPIGARWKGFLVAFLGAGIVGISLGVGGGLTALVVLGAAVCQGLYHVAVKPLAEELGALAATMWTVWAGALLSLPALPQLIADGRHASAGSTYALIYLGVVPSAFGFLMWSFALARTSVARGTVALYLVPVVAMGLSWVWLGEAPTLLAVIGGTIAVAGVVLVRRAGEPAGTPYSPSPALLHSSR
jgi:drug/metabolite transporter (DMT)-like permease